MIGVVRAELVMLTRMPSITRSTSVDRLSAHDAESLTARLIEAGGSASAARVTAAKVLRFAYRAASEAPAWTEASLKAAGIGAWAVGALARLDPVPSLSIVERAPASDGTVRLLLRAIDAALVETVIIPGPSRTTLCISSQVGCARACTFCETGRLGLTRQLSAAEIVDQVRLARGVPMTPGTPAIQNIVFMGMGEPFDNLSEVLRSIRLLTDARAFGFSPSRVTVSTVGVVDKLGAFFAGARAELAVSLNASTDEQRARIMPVNTRWPLAALREGLIASLPAGRHVLFEYVLFDGVNDALEDADRVAAFVSGVRSRVNVIPSNPGPDPELGPPSPEKLEAFVRRLASHGVTTLVRRPRGRDVGGACGQLAGARRLQRSSDAGAS